MNTIFAFWAAVKNKLYAFVFLHLFEKLFIPVDFKCDAVHPVIQRVVLKSEDVAHGLPRQFALERIAFAFLSCVTCGFYCRQRFPYKSKICNILLDCLAALFFLNVPEEEQLRKLADKHSKPLCENLNAQLRKLDSTLSPITPMSLEK